jgi:hypothetical protein
LQFALQQRFVKIHIDRKLRGRPRQLGVGSQIGHPNPQLKLQQAWGRCNARRKFQAP